jgi:predicted nucleic acid-binding protein|tara:strand:- start:1296 stop:1787 length:492 start_codon:yes stop_codon:yes gene_type:complete
MRLVFDSGPLIYLGKIRILEKLTGFKNIIPYLVYQEVVKEGKKLGKEDAFYVETLVEENVFTVMKSKEVITSLPDTSLSKADREVLNLAKQKKATAVIDEEVGRKIAEVIGVDTLGSVGVLFTLLRNKKISKLELKESIESMIEAGWFCSTYLYTKILKELNL